MNKICPKCEGNMVPGRRRDKMDGYATQEKWLEGEPAREIVGWISGLGETHPVITFACKECGYLESYLHDRQKE